MSRLSAFLHPVPVQQEKEVVISDRFVDENGNAVPFKIRALTQEENDAHCQAEHAHAAKSTGSGRKSLDNIELSRRMVVAATVEPDFARQRAVRRIRRFRPAHGSGQDAAVGRVCPADAGNYRPERL